MRKLLDTIAIRNLNTVQRSGYFATIVGCLILIVLHNPMSSYDLYEPKVSEINASAECLAASALYSDYAYSTEPSKERVGKKAGATLIRLNCFGNWFKPFSEWTTYSPLVAWLGNVVNLLFSIFAVLGVGCFWLFVFRTTKPVGADD